MNVQLMGLSPDEMRSAIQAALFNVRASQIISKAAPAVADTPFSVAHGLGVVPKMVVAMVDSDAAVYVTEDDRREWTARQIRVRCTSANANLVIEVKA